jgi:hypothetical protein
MSQAEDDRLAFECSRTWDSLARTTDEDVRHCDSCKHLVHRVHSDADLAEHARRGHCVSILPDPYTWPVGAMRTGRPRPAPNGAGTSWLVVMNGARRGAVIMLVGGVITVGRAEADIVLEEALAPQQLRFVRETGKLVCYDLMDPAAPGRELRDGDIVSIGELRAVFKTVVDEQEVPPPAWL